jgi:hypothetical protein
MAASDSDGLQQENALLMPTLTEPHPQVKQAEL